MFSKKLSAAELAALFTTQTIMAELNKERSIELGQLVQARVTTKFINDNRNCRVLLEGKLNEGACLRAVSFMIRLENSPAGWQPWYGHLLIKGCHHEFHFSSLPANKIAEVKLCSGRQFPDLETSLSL